MAVGRCGRRSGCVGRSRGHTHLEVSHGVELHALLAVPRAPVGKEAGDAARVPAVSAARRSARLRLAARATRARPRPARSRRAGSRASAAVLCGPAQQRRGAHCPLASVTSAARRWSSQARQRCACCVAGRAQASTRVRDQAPARRAPGTLTTPPAAPQAPPARPPVPRTAAHSGRAARTDGVRSACAQPGIWRGRGACSRVSAQSRAQGLRKPRGRAAGCAPVRDRRMAGHAWHTAHGASSACSGRCLPSTAARPASSAASPCRPRRRAGTAASAHVPDARSRPRRGQR